MKMRRSFVYVERAAAVVVRTLTAYGAGILKFGGHNGGRYVRVRRLFIGQSALWV